MNISDFVSNTEIFLGDGWANGDDDHFVAVADFDFESAQEDELSFQRGQTIIVAPKG